MAGHQSANTNWRVRSPFTTEAADSTEHAMLAVLMDLRTELQTLNARLIEVRDRLAFAQCPDFRALPRVLQQIRRNTTKRRRVRR